MTPLFHWITSFGLLGAGGNYSFINGRGAIYLANHPKLLNYRKGQFIGQAVVYKHVVRPTVMSRQAHSEWYANVMKLKSELESSPDDLELAQQFWHAISGSAGYDVRDGKRVMDTFRKCALKSDDGLAAMVSAFRKLADDSGEFPRASLFDPPMENLFLMIARQAGHPLNADAKWILSHIDTDD